MRSTRSLSADINALVNGAIQFHGHLGPYMILGLKAGLAAVEGLGKDPFKMRAIVNTGLSPPSSCFIDGVQFASGCTLGKGNLEVREGNGISALFIKEGKELKITVKREVLVELAKVSDGLMEKDEQEELALSLAARRSDELFEVGVISESGGSA